MYILTLYLRAHYTYTLDEILCMNLNIYDNIVVCIWLQSQGENNSNPLDLICLLEKKKKNSSFHFYLIFSWMELDFEPN